MKALAALPISDATLRFGERVMTSLLGLDALYREESPDGGGLAVVNLDTEGRFAADDFPTYAAARAQFEELSRDLADLPEPDRRVYYRDLCDSTLAFIRWRHTGLAFRRQLGDFLHVDVNPAPAAELDTLKTELSSLLVRMGYVGDLREQCAAWEQDHRVPADEVAGVLETLLDAAWDRTQERVLEIPAAKADGMRVRGVSGVSYNACCDYLARCVEVNIDPVLTLPALRHLAVHEGYPGHYVQFKLRQTMFRDGLVPADGLLSVVNTASSSVFEGIADTGMEMLGWTEPLEDRFQAVMNRYRAGIGTGAAWRLHALGESREKVAGWLGDRSLVGGEGWVTNRMSFIDAPERAVLIWSYWWGERVVAPTWRRVRKSQRPEFLRYLYGRMHSNRSVNMFQTDKDPPCNDPG